MPTKIKADYLKGSYLQGSRVTITGDMKGPASITYNGKNYDWKSMSPSYGSTVTVGTSNVDVNNYYQQYTPVLHTISCFHTMTHEEYTCTPSSTTERDITITVDVDYISNIISCTGADAEIYSANQIRLTNITDDVIIEII